MLSIAPGSCRRCPRPPRRRRCACARLPRSRRVKTPSRSPRVVATRRVGARTQDLLGAGSRSRSLAIDQRGHGRVRPDEVAAVLEDGGAGDVAEVEAVETGRGEQLVVKGAPPPAPPRHSPAPPPGRLAICLERLSGAPRPASPPARASPRPSSTPGATAPVRRRRRPRHPTTSPLTRRRPAARQISARIARPARADPPPALSRSPGPPAPLSAYGSPSPHCQVWAGAAHRPAALPFELPDTCASPTGPPYQAPPEMCISRRRPPVAALDRPRHSCTFTQTCGINSAVECQLPKLKVAGSNPVSRSMNLSRAEIDEMLRRADEVRLKLRRATRELAALGEQLLRPRDPVPNGDRSR